MAPVVCDTQTTAGPAQLSTQSSLLGAGTDFMQRLGSLAWYKSGASAPNNPQGGGAEEFGQRYRTWLEGYDTWSRMDAQGTFPGDHRRTYGGVAGFGVTVTPGVTLGLSVDQSRTKIDVAGDTQTGRIDLTQIGAIAAFEHGPWNLGATVIRGFGSVHSSRFATTGASTAAYFANLWGAMTELSYFHALPDNWRLVPKLTFDWMRAESDAFTETGGIAPVSGNSVVSSRVRMMVGAEVGHSWLLDRTIMDLAMYGRLVDNLSQESGTLTVKSSSGITLPATLLGLRESTLGGDAGATLSAKVSEMLRLYAVYDGRFRSNFTSHSGTVGAEWRF